VTIINVTAVHVLAEVSLKVSGWSAWRRATFKWQCLENATFLVIIRL